MNRGAVLPALSFAAIANGQPDLQGIWSNTTITPLERPSDLAGKQTFTAQEAAAYERQIVDRNNVDHRTASADADVTLGYNDFWWDHGTQVVRSRRTSLIVNPPDGRVPPLTSEAQKRMQETRASIREHATDGPEGPSLAERCILWTIAGPPMLPGTTTISRFCKRAIT